MLIVAQAVIIIFLMLRADHYVQNLLSMHSISICQSWPLDFVAPVQGYYFKKDLLDLNSMGYPKLPSAMLGSESVLLNLLTFYSYPVPLKLFYNVYFSS
jgi:hypothetical protein